MECSEWIRKVILLNLEIIPKTLAKYSETDKRWATLGIFDGLLWATVVIAVIQNKAPLVNGPKTNDKCAVYSMRRRCFDSAMIYIINRNNIATINILYNVLFLAKISRSAAAMRTRRNIGRCNLTYPNFIFISWISFTRGNIPASYTRGNNIPASYTRGNMVNLQWRIFFGNHR